VTFLASTAIVFLLTVALPGDPARAIAGQRRVSEATRAALSARYGLDEPVWRQYLAFVGRLLRGDLGESYAARRPVASILAEALPTTFTLVGLTIVIEVFLALTIGAAVARRSGRHVDHLVLALCVAALSMPLFLVGSLLQRWVGVGLGWLPVAGTDAGLGSYVLPACTLALPGAAIAIRMVRIESIRQLSAAHVQTARSKGLRERTVVRRHVVRNAAVPFISFVGLEVGALAGGAIVVERVFNLPGVGQAIAEAIRQRDNALIIGFTLAIIAVYLLVDMLVDIAAVVANPRIELSA